MVHKLYGSQGEVLNTPQEIADANTAKNNFWAGIQMAAGGNNSKTLIASDLAILNQKVTLEIVVKHLSNRANIQFEVRYNNTPTLFNQPPLNVNIGNIVSQQGNNDDFRFRIHAITIAHITNHLSTGLEISLGDYNGQISLLLLKQNPFPLHGGAMVIHPHPHPLNMNMYANRNPAGGVKIP
jgi:hypothetical protein